MDQSTQKPGFTKPIGGFIVVLTVAVLVGVWLYVDMVKNELERKVEGLSRELEAARQDAREGAEGKRTAPPAEEKDGWSTYAGALGGYRFQLDLPEGWHLSVSADAQADSAYVVMDPTPENEAPIPDMVIRLVDPNAEPYASSLTSHEAGTRLVLTADGEAAFWITGWEDLAWPEFDEAAASFKAL